jgi:hypothetical protein
MVQFCSLGSYFDTTLGHLDGWFHDKSGGKSPLRPIPGQYKSVWQTNCSLWQQRSLTKPNSRKNGDREGHVALVAQIEGLLFVSLIVCRLIGKFRLW